MQFSAILMSIVSILMELTMRLMLIDLVSNWNAFSHDNYHDNKTFTWSKVVDGQFSHLLFHVVRIKIHCIICCFLKGCIKIYFLLNCPASDCLVFAVPANYVTRVQINWKKWLLIREFQFGQHATDEETSLRIIMVLMMIMSMMMIILQQQPSKQFKEEMICIRDSKIFIQKAMLEKY